MREKRVQCKQVGLSSCGRCASKSHPEVPGAGLLGPLETQEVSSQGLVFAASFLVSVIATSQCQLEADIERARCFHGSPWMRSVWALQRPPASTSTFHTRVSVLCRPERVAGGHSVC